MAETVFVRRAEPRDASAVQALVFASLREFGLEPDPDGLDRDITAFGSGDPRLVTELVADDGSGRALGCVVVTPTNGDTAHLSKLFVDAAARGRGVGRILLAAAVGDTRERGLTRMDLWTRARFTAAIALYEATGWRRGPDLHDGSGEGPEWTYVLELAAA